MRFVHTADLHIGRRIGQLSLSDDIGHVLVQLEDLLVAQEAELLVVAGDVFDAPVPPEWAVRMWDAFLVSLAQKGIVVVAVGGNHDSGARLAQGASFARAAGVHVAGELAGDVPCVLASEGVAFWLLPFVRPADVRAWAASRDIDASSVVDYHTAVLLVLDAIRASDAYLDASANVLVAHQFVTADGKEPARSDSERTALGTLDRVDVSAFEGFDYVALGHVHRPQRVGGETCRYAGSPLKYSASEIAYPKSFVAVDVSSGAGAPEVSCRLEPVVPLRDFREERGLLDQLISRGEQEDASAREDFVRAVVCDDVEPQDVAARLRRVWPNLAEVEFDNARTRAEGVAPLASVREATRDARDLFRGFFEGQAGRELTPLELAAAERAFSQAGISDVGLRSGEGEMAR